MDLITGVGVVVVSLLAVRLAVVLTLNTIRDVRDVWRRFKRDGDI